jgi:hypothetical protein
LPDLVLLHLVNCAASGSRRGNDRRSLVGTLHLVFFSKMRESVFTDIIDDTAFPLLPPFGGGRDGGGGGGRGLS